MKDITPEGIKKIIEDKFTASITHYIWEEEGQQCSSWKVDCGGHSVFMGDEGRKLFEEALLKAGAKEIEKK